MNEKYAEIENYEFKKDIGQGNFGKVKLGIFKPTGEEFAIKILNKQKIKKKMKNVQFKENEIITKFNHINVIYVYQIIENPENYYIIMEYCEKDLFDYIVEKDHLSEDEASIFFYQLINGVEYIHKTGIVHRDLKPENILLTKDKTLKIIDFGLSHEYEEKNLLKTKCGSPSYASPEIISGKPYEGFQVDVWCCGIILYAMVCGYLPFEGENNKILFKAILQCNPDYPKFLSDSCKKLLKAILKVDPLKRITIDEIKKSEFYLKGKKNCKIDYKGIENELIKRKTFFGKISKDNSINLNTDSNVHSHADSNIESNIKNKKFKLFFDCSNKNKNENTTKNIDSNKNIKENIFRQTNKDLINNVKKNIKLLKEFKNIKKKEIINNKIDISSKVLPTDFGIYSPKKNLANLNLKSLYLNSTGKNKDEKLSLIKTEKRNNIYMNRCDNLDKIYNCNILPQSNEKSFENNNNSICSENSDKKPKPNYQNFNKLNSSKKNKKIFSTDKNKFLINTNLFCNDINININNITNNNIISFGNIKNPKSHSKKESLISKYINTINLNASPKTKYNKILISNSVDRKKNTAFRDKYLLTINNKYDKKNENIGLHGYINTHGNDNSYYKNTSSPTSKNSRINTINVFNNHYNFERHRNSSKRIINNSKNKDLINIIGKNIYNNNILFTPKINNNRIIKNGKDIISVLKRSQIKYHEN